MENLNPVAWCGKPNRTIVYAFGGATFAPPPPGVGITGELHHELIGPDVSSSQGPGIDQARVWQDPTERLAVSLGLKVSQLAHVTGHTPGNPDGALHRLRYAAGHHTMGTRSWPEGLEFDF